jgi:hypothetical protein
LEKTPSFREEEREPIEIHLLIVRFDLGEVGVRREIEREVSGERISHVESRFSGGRVLVAKPKRRAGRGTLQARVALRWSGHTA